MIFVDHGPVHRGGQDVDRIAAFGQMDVFKCWFFRAGCEIDPVLLAVNFKKFPLIVFTKAIYEHLHFIILHCSAQILLRTL